MKDIVISQRILPVFAMIFTLLFNTASQAYSYAAAGKEPVIEVREAVIQAIARQDFGVVRQHIDTLKEEFDYLKNEHQVDLYSPIVAAIQLKNTSQIEALLNRVIYEEIVRRLDGAEQNLGDYQVAKVLVVKSKLFLDLLAPNLPEQQRQQATQAIQGVLTSIGNPGVFGVGQAPANPEAYAEQRAALLAALSRFQS